MLNSFSGIGRVSADPTITKSENGDIVAELDIVINEFYKADGDLHKKSHHIPGIAHGRLAEIIGEFVTKGSQVGVRGPLRATNGDGKGKLIISINELEFLSSRAAMEQDPV